MPKIKIRKNKNESKTLHGLVIVDKLKMDTGGKNQSLFLADKYLRINKIHLSFLSSSSPHRLLLSLLNNILKKKQFRYDFVVFNSMASLYYVNIRGHFTGVGYLLARAFLKLKIPIFMYWHETDWVFEKIEKENPRRLNKIDKLASHPDIFHLAASDACSRYIHSRYGVKVPITINECSILPEGYNQVLQPSDPPIIVNIASIQERKGTDLFVKTAIKVCEKHPTVEFIWIGDGNAYGTWEKDIKAAGLQNRILFPGYIHCPHILLRNASMFFLSSRDDPFPLSVIEAMCLGRTIMTFNVGGAPEALKEYGILIPPYDTDKAAAAILGCLNSNPANLINHAVRQRYFNRYTPMHFAVRLNNCIRKIIK